MFYKYRHILACIIFTTLVLLTACDKVMDTPVKIADSIIKSYGSKKTSSRLLDVNNLSFIDISSNLGHKIVSEMNSDEFILEISFIAKDINGRAYPTEIYAIFDCFLSLQEKCQIDNVVAIVCSYSSGFAFDYETWMVVIPYNEFEILYNNSHMDDKNNEELIKELGDNWINKNHYNRKGLEYNDNDKYKESLITQWKSSQVSYDNVFVARYYYGGNKLSVDIITYLSETVSSTRKIYEIEISNTGFLYGVWDEHYNIWLYGEGIGLKLLKYNGENNWIYTDCADISQIPYPLKRTIEG